MPQVLHDHSAEYAQAQADYTAKHADTIAAEGTEKAQAQKLAALNARLANTRREHAALTTALLQSAIDGQPIDASGLGAVKLSVPFLVQATQWHKTFALADATEAVLVARLAECRARHAATVARKLRDEFNLVKSLTGVAAQHGGIQMSGAGEIARQHEELIRQCLIEVAQAERNLASHREGAVIARQEYHARYGGAS